MGPKKGSSQPTARQRRKILELSHFMKCQWFLDSNGKIKLVRLHQDPHTHIMMCCFFEIQNQLTKAETNSGTVEPLFYQPRRGRQSEYKK